MVPLPGVPLSSSQPLCTSSKWLEISGTGVRGDTPDISHLLQFFWYEPVLYKDTNPKFPHTKELPGHFIGIAKNTGDALTFKILCEDGRTIIERSVVRSAIDPKHCNRRVKFEDDIEEKLESLEVINPFVIPKKERTDVKDDNDSNDNDLVMNNKDIEEAGGIASRTRSRTLMAFHVNAVDSTKTKSPGLITIFKLMPYLVLFFLHSAMSCSAATPRVGDMPDLGEADALKCQNALVTATENTWEQL